VLFFDNSALGGVVAEALAKGFSRSLKLTISDSSQDMTPKTKRL
jgi:hypothetical protein